MTSVMASCRSVRRPGARYAVAVTILPGVAAGHVVTAQAGADVLAAGGHAVDAAVAMMLVSCAAETIFTGLGGGGFATVYDAETRTVRCVDFFVSVPGLGGGRRGPRRTDRGHLRRSGHAVRDRPAHGRGARRPGRRVPPVASVGPAAVGGRGRARSGGESGHSLLGRPCRTAAAGGTGLSGRRRGGGVRAARTDRCCRPATCCGTPITRTRTTCWPRTRPLSTTGSTPTPLVAAVAGSARAGPIRPGAVHRRRVRAARGGLRRIRRVRPRQRPRRRPRHDGGGGPVDARRSAARSGDRSRPGRGAAWARIAAPRRRTSVRSTADGNACAITTSLGLGSGVWVPGFGVHLNSMLGEGELIRGVPRPGTRLGSMMSPLVAVDADRRPVVVAGAAGGSRIRPALVQCVLRMLNGEAPQSAIDQPRLNALPGLVRLEPGFSEEVIDGVAAGRRRGRGDRRSATRTSVGSRRWAPRAAGRIRGARGRCCSADPLPSSLAPVTPPPGPPSRGLTPTSTYRLQIRAAFTLSDAAAVVGYLGDLGVGALYLSPILQSTSGSDHGYDTTDPRRIDEARGGEAGWAELLAAAGEAGLSVVVDIVPNHVGIASAIENPAWWDVLRLGRSSPYASWFDVDWDRRIVVPILGDDADPDRGRRRAAVLRAPFPAGAGQLVRGRRTRGRPRPAALRAGSPLARQRRAQLSPLLRGDHAGRDPPGGPRRLRGHPRADRRTGGRRHRRAARSTTPTVCSIRRTTWNGCGRSLRRSGSRWRRSWSRASSCRTGRWPAPPATTRCARSTESSSIPRPSRCSPSSTSASPATSSPPRSTWSRANRWW